MVLRCSSTPSPRCGRHPVRSRDGRPRLDVRTGVRIHAAEWADSSWRLDTSDGPIETNTPIAATGTWSTSWQPPHRRPRPVRRPGSSLLRVPQPRIGGRRPGPRVWVGDSSSEIAVEVADAGRDVAISVRSGALFVPRPPRCAFRRRARICSACSRPTSRTLRSRPSAGTTPTSGSRSRRPAPSIATPSPDTTYRTRYGPGGSSSCPKYDRSASIEPSSQTETNGSSTPS